MSSGVALNSRFIMFSPHRLALNQAVTCDRRIVVRIESSHVGAENIVVRAKRRESVSFRVPLLNSTRETRFSFFFFFVDSSLRKTKSAFTLPSIDHSRPRWSAFISFRSRILLAQKLRHASARMDSSIESARWARWARWALRKML